MESVLHSRYLTVYNRKIRFSGNGVEERCIEYDVVGHPGSDFKFVCVAPFHSPETTASGEPEFTIVEEFCQGSNSRCIVFPSGCYEKGKHGCLEDVVREELHQEAQLTGGRTLKLISTDHPGLLETKWSRNRLHPFLNIGSIQSSTAVEKDPEEFMLTHDRVTLAEFKKLMYSGTMMMPSIITGQMAIEYLLQAGLITSEHLGI